MPADIPITSPRNELIYYKHSGLYIQRSLVIFSGSIARGFILNSEHEHTVLIVEDDAPYRRYLKGALERSVLSPNIYEAEDVATANAGIKNLNPDLVLMDIRLPDGSGFEVVRKQREDHEDLSVIFITGFDDLEFLREARNLGAVAFFTKANLKTEELLEAVDSALSCRYVKTA